MIQEPKDEVTEFIKEDLWDGIRDFLNAGLHLGEGEDSIHITVGLLLLVGLVIGLINLLVKPLVTLLSLPALVLTLGLFYLVINGALSSQAAAAVSSSGAWSETV